MHTDEYSSHEGKTKICLKSYWRNFINSAFSDVIRKFWHTLYNGGLGQILFVIINKEPIYLSKKYRLIYSYREQSCKKVMFSLVSVSVCSQWVPCDQYSWCIKPHCTGPPPPTRHQTLDPSQPWPYPHPPATSDMGPQLHPLLVTSGGLHWRPVKTCALKDFPTGTVIWRSKLLHYRSNGHALQNRINSCNHLAK